MNITKYFNKTAFLSLLSLFCVLSVAAQASKTPAPREEKLLNGLKLLMWQQPNAEKVAVKIRVHSGSAFDPQTKEGTMSLLADALFPNETVKEFFREDLGGSLDVSSNYDYIQIDATANADQLLLMLETLANALTNPQIDKETTVKLRLLKLEKLKENENDAAYLADRAIARRLFGDFPYGRAQAGTSESLQKIDFADLLLAREKFLTPDNTTIAVSGNFKPDLVFRAAKRFFGSWVKADKKVPATFRQPETGDEKPLILDSAFAGDAQTRFAIRGLARSDKDFFAAAVLTKILQNRLQNSFSKDSVKDVFVRQQTNLLPSLIVFGYSSASANASQNKTENPVNSLLKNPATSEEFGKAKIEFLNEFNNRNLIENWLDVDTYKLNSVQEETQKANNVTISDVNRLIGNFQKNPVVTIFIVKKTEEKAATTDK